MATNLKSYSCVFLASGYKWVTVMHEIPISSAQSMTSFHTLGLSSTTPLVPLKRGVFHMRRFQRVRRILEDSVAAALWAVPQPRFLPLSHHRRVHRRRADMCLSSIFELRTTLKDGG